MEYEMRGSKLKKMKRKARVSSQKVLKRNTRNKDMRICLCVCVHETDG